MSEAVAVEKDSTTALGSTEKLPVVTRINDDDGTPPSLSSPSGSKSPRAESPAAPLASSNKCKCSNIRADIRMMLKDLKTMSKRIMQRAPLNGGLIHWALQECFIMLALMEGQLDGEIQAMFFFRLQIEYFFIRKNKANKTIFEQKTNKQTNKQ